MQSKFISEVKPGEPSSGKNTKSVIRVNGKTGFEEICDMVQNEDDTVCDENGWKIINSTLNHPQLRDYLEVVDHLYGFRDWSVDP